MSSYEFIIIIQYVAVFILFADMVYAMFQRPSELQKYVIVLAVSTILMFVGYIVELKAMCIEQALVGTAISYLGKPFIMIASMMFICQLYNFRVPNILRIALTLYGAFISLVVATNNYHHLYYEKTGFDISQDFSPLIVSRGPLYYSYVILAAVYFIACLYLTITGYKRSKDTNRLKIAAYILAMILSGLAGYAIYLSGATGSYDSTMLGVFAGAIFLSVLFLKFRLFDVSTMAKDQAIEDSDIGLVVFDSNEKIVYQNAMSIELNRRGISNEYISGLRSANKNHHSEDRVYNFMIQPLMVKGTYLGRSVEIRDITDAHNYQKKLEHEVEKRTEKIEKIQRNIISSIANIVETRGLEKKERVYRMEKIVELTAKALRDIGMYKDVLSDEYIDILASATPLHDIGKIAVLDSILLKDGELTDNEFEEMKRHTLAGAAIIDETMRGIESDEYVRTAEEIARYHHERWDGLGYPEGLKGTKIPLSARIVSIVDYFDTCVLKHSNDTGYSLENSILTVKQESGTYFDPLIVQAFISVMNEYDPEGKEE